MTISRRFLFRAGAAAGLTMSLPLAKPLIGAVGARHKSPAAGSLERLTQAHFEDQVGTRFRVTRQAVSAELQLSAVRDLSRPRLPYEPKVSGEVFSAMFAGSRENPIPQEVYQISHGGLGTFSLLIVPVGEDRSNRYYEAVINRRTP